MSEEPVIEIHDLRKSYGETLAVNGITLSVRRGEVFGVLGPNGAGKTTTVEMAVGLRTPDSGSVRVLGLDPASDPDHVRQRVGVQLQHAVLPNRMKVREAMAVFAAAYVDPADPETLLSTWGLQSQRRTAFGSLSGGQRQRLFIALALLGRPEIVVLDELTTGLDPAARRDTWAMVEALKAQGVTVVLVTHGMDEAETLCDRLVVIDRGQVVAHGTPDEVRGEHRTLEAAYLGLTAPTFGKVA
jgi:ABC-2 type transport system ATP-binding protein